MKRYPVDFAAMSLGYEYHGQELGGKKMLPDRSYHSTVRQASASWLLAIASRGINGRVSGETLHSFYALEIIPWDMGGHK